MKFNRIAMWLPMVAAALAVAGCTPAVTGAGADPNVANPITGGPQIGRCFMGGCGWYQIRSFDVVRETEQGALIRLDMRDGSSRRRGDAASPRSSRGVDIDWGEYEKDEYVFCSSRLPAMISTAEGGGGWEALRLDLTMSSGATEYITNVYGHVCHPDGELNSEGAAERLGYRRYEGQDHTIRLSAPEAIFGHLGR